MKKKAYLYQRFSSDQQIGNSSIYRQSFKQHQWLEAHPEFECEGEYVDESKSASKGEHLKRGELGDLVSEIEQGKVEKGSYILVEGFSRLSRLDTPETEELLRKIWKAGITIVTVQNGQEYPPDTESNFGLRIQLLVEVNGAYLESKIRSERIKGSYDRRESQAKEGKTIKIKKPFWLDEDGKLNDGKYIIKNIFNWYVREGLGQQRIYQRLKEQYPDYEPFKNLAPSTVIRWIKSKSAIGYWVRFAGMENEREYKVFEAAVGLKIFYKAASINIHRHYKNIKPDSNMALHGLLECGHCGGGITVQKSYHKNGMPLLRCSRQARYGKQHCGFKSTYPYSIAYYLYENIVYNEMIGMLSEQNLRPIEEQELNKIEHQLSSAEKKYNKLKDRMLNLDDDSDDDAITDLMSELSTKRKQLKTRKNQLEKNLDDRPPYIDDDIRELEKNPKELNLNFNQLQKKIIIKDKTVFFESDSRYEITYDGYSQREKGYQITRNFLIISKDLSNPEIVHKYADLYDGEGSLESNDPDDPYQQYMRELSEKPHEEVKITEFLKTTDICKKVK
ncbi:recombinase family protein [Colwellia polaris]|uniref:recombinase family protein n=1 Tax=Colwellia polaris TaxID=326537 RepID=UPI000A16E78A|nr:recombinase family protein [Colwellia polaris]